MKRAAESGGGAGTVLDTRSSEASPAPKGRRDRDPRASGRKSALAGGLQVQRSGGSTVVGIPEEQRRVAWLEWSRVEVFRGPGGP